MGPQKPIISLIIPCHNEQEYIAETLFKAFRAAKNTYAEIIVVDNNSTDRTKEIVYRLRALSPCPVKYVYEERKGLLYAREAGRKAAESNYLAYIDADTHIPSNYLRVLVDILHRDTSIAGLGMPYGFHDAPWYLNIGVKVFFAYWFLYELVACNLCKQPHFLYGPCFVVRANAMEAIGGFDTTISFYGEDSDTTKRIGKYGKTRFIWSLCPRTSSRRYQKLGIFKTCSIYFRNYVSVMFRGFVAGGEQ
jgi:glycosyltransferase involved in cell wall biosynthesis